jgi:hypothetical protein
MATTTGGDDDRRRYGRVSSHTDFPLEWELSWPVEGFLLRYHGKRLISRLDVAEQALSLSTRLIFFFRFSMKVNASCRRSVVDSKICLPNLTV